MIPAVDSKAVTFADGLVHVIDAANSFPFEGAIVQDSLGGLGTTVNVVPGGDIGSGREHQVELFGSSVLNMSGMGGMAPHQLPIVLVVRAPMIVKEPIAVDDSHTQRGELEQYYQACRQHV